MLHSPQRRRLLLASAGLAGLTGTACVIKPFTLPGFEPFTLGVASGEPVSDGFVIWTRLAPEPLRDTGLDEALVPVGWEVAEDERFQRIARRGVAPAEPAWGHSVHVEVDGLAPDRWYWYRFRYASAVSPVGRTRTAPALWARFDRLRFGYASCQHYETGYYSAYRHLAADAPDLILHLGDYIYESSVESPLRSHGAAEPYTLEDYRNRYARYRSDPDLQAAHAACPWLVIWDDHEVDDDYAGPYGRDGEAVDNFLLRRAAAYQAYWEHMPLRLSARPQGARMDLYRRSVFGDLLSFHLLDMRQHRDAQACASGQRGGQVVAPCAELRDPSRSMLGSRQEAWLLQGLGPSPVRWNLIAQTTLMASLDLGSGAQSRVWTDGWSGYPAARERILRHLAARRPANPVVLGGDIHAFCAAELTPAGAGQPVATEFVGSSITTPGASQDVIDGLKTAHPHLQFFDGRHRGYVLCELNAERLDVAFRAVDDVRNPEASVSTLAQFTVESGAARIHRA